jgi:hypothetical protein
VGYQEAEEEAVVVEEEEEASRAFQVFTSKSAT